ncbi:hypothetical protein PFAG_01986 [Plasmodium falciparum Santa Lucia]|uniref:Uncharacterized protein n=5 Tax=Plasmodium falciparum TaxID=5833 RepID=A0A024W8C7_PLAFA|nr:hypothetical protein PFTANZ_02106 [Plasmodium falciparum Tanzania (2000708)]ETW49857.1 hypothetical protein PFMALIP_02047 [Plasmodium falciparum MaliPS096_E11]ETW61893.1 hypothetical protein PFMC_01996 [Plasmodium falciparum CAMP/Malaysia]EUT87160.1 hypothetical protein PFAG_01986 [Plasmodium falciparum Santa Lucia]EWC77214.1 hypothetical protein C923_02140 [Plasmodium falciparum UGT5.1]
MFYKYIINIHYDLIYIFLKILSPSTYVEYYYKASIYMSSTFNIIRLLLGKIHYDIYISILIYKITPMQKYDIYKLIINSINI